ncbi:hypothetical protein M8J76_003657 [Diaphorina citri]|nr:hypothetical protein M8J75_015145 [Diaphorina citri]KAI5740418.1 hypothetical protein M8J76_003657 [Diaphorina citri]KAI5748368.1 hypothetical protein M8J77_024811 [Diaphorina citri]
MNSIFASLAFVATLALVNARPQAPPASPIPIISYVNEPPVDGTYKFAFETGNGIAVQEQGALKNAGQKDLEAQTAQGQSSYTSPDGTPIQTQWYADETGYHASGAHLPTPPPIPDEIAKAIATLPKLVEENYAPNPQPAPGRGFGRK